jgi:hypothetical protein
MLSHRLMRSTYMMVASDLHDDADESFDDGFDEIIFSAMTTLGFDMEPIRARDLAGGRRSCGFLAACSLRPVVKSTLCQLHHGIIAIAIMAAQKAEQNLELVQLWNTREDEQFQLDIAFHVPAQGNLAMFRGLQRICDDFVVWQIDVEFATVLPRPSCMQLLK